MASLANCTGFSFTACIAEAGYFASPVRKPIIAQTTSTETEPWLPPPPSSPPVTAPQAPQRPAEPSTRAAYQPLLDGADAAAAGGDYEHALALLQRAQRIDPDSAQVYLGMARTHRARGDDAQARATAERGLLYCRTAPECDALRAYVR